MNFRQNGDWITQHSEEPKGFSHKLISVIGFLIIVVPIVLLTIGHYSK